MPLKGANTVPHEVIFKENGMLFFFWPVVYSSLSGKPRAHVKHPLHTDPTRWPQGMFASKRIQTLDLMEMPPRPRRKT
jgi:hypothetical protein